MKIEITEGMELAVAGYRLAVGFMKAATTEAAAEFWKESAERHRANLGAMVERAIGAVAVEDSDWTVHICKPMHLAVAVPAEQVEKARKEVGT